VGATTDGGEFSRQTEPFRRELLAHCYRMLGSLHEAEDAVQETYIRAWRSYGEFEARSSLRTWLYRIATNVCLSALRRPGRRVLPSGLGAATPDPRASLADAGPDVMWLEPIPDALVTAGSGDPATVVTARESLRLALIAALQFLPARQRAVLILREVLGFPAAEVAAMLGTSTAAVKSALQRARARMDEAAPAADELTEPTDPRARALLDRYIAAFENSDPETLVAALRADAALEMVGTPTWFSGIRTCLPFMDTPMVLGSAGEWRMIPVMANGQPATVTYRRGPDGVYRAYGVAVLTVAAAGITRIVVFGDPGLVTRFGFPEVHRAADPTG
jgi:RNA polymerase sigma-70 factor, ECF subfamily